MTFELIKECNIDFSKYEMPSVAKNLLQKVLIKNPDERLGAQNIHDLMAHPFFEGINFQNINDQLPPKDDMLQLNMVQETIMKYLPKFKNKKCQSPMPKKSVKDLTNIDFNLKLTKNHSDNNLLERDNISQDISDVSSYKHSSDGNDSDNSKPFGRDFA